MSDDTIPVFFEWIEYLPEIEQYKQNSIILYPTDMEICIEVPADPIYISLNGKEGKTVLTMEGLKYIRDQFKEALNGHKVQLEPDPDEDVDWNLDEDDWDSARQR